MSFIYVLTPESDARGGDRRSALGLIVEHGAAFHGAPEAELRGSEGNGDKHNSCTETQNERDEGRHFGIVRFSRSPCTFEHGEEEKNRSKTADDSCVTV